MDDHGMTEAGRVALPAAAGDGPPGARSHEIARAGHPGRRADAASRSRVRRPYRSRAGVSLWRWPSSLPARRALARRSAPSTRCPTDLATPSGTITNAVYGFTSMLVKVARRRASRAHRRRLRHAGAPTFRNDDGRRYKAGRKETPDLFRPQLPLIRQVARRARDPRSLEVDGVEADDVIATLATQRGRRRDRRDRRHRRPRLATSSFAIRTSRSSTTSAASPTTRSTTRPGSSSAPGSRPRSTPSTRRCAATRATTSPGCPGSARRPRPSCQHLRRPRGHLRAPRGPAAEAAPEPRRVPATRCSTTGRCRCCVATCPVDVDAGRAADRRRGTTRTVRVLFDQLEFRTLLPAAARGASETPPPRSRRTATRSTSRSSVARDGDGGPGRVSRRSRRRGEPVRARGPLGRRARHQRRSAASRSPTRTATPRTSTRELLGGAGGGRRARGARSARAGRRSSRTGRRSSCTGSAVDATGARTYDTAVMAYLLDPAEGKLRPRRSRACASCGFELQSPDAEPRGRSTSTATPRSTRPAGAPPPCCALGPMLRDGARGTRAHCDLYERLRAPAGAGAGPAWRRPASASTASSSRPCAPISQQQCDAARSGGSTRTRARSST